MKLIQKIANAKKQIKETKIKKEGKNDFAKYAYFTPSQTEQLVNDVCESNGLLIKFDLIRNELGVFGRLTIFDCDSDETLQYEMATAIPEIKATNIAQQLGGCVTYTERYLKTSAFGIVDNNLDFDAKNNAPAPIKDTDHDTIMKHVALKTSEAELTAYYKQLSESDQKNKAIIAIFTTRKQQITK